MRFAVLALWALAWRWPFPRALPESWTIEILRGASAAAGRPSRHDLALAFVSTLGALALAVAWLEGDDRRGARLRRATAVSLPLLLPQLAFLFGVETLFASLRLDGSFLAVAWAHALFVFPYVLLALADPGARSIRATPALRAALGAAASRRLSASSCRSCRGR